MSLRGVGKAIYRTPHHLFGRKTAEDEIYKQWEHDISVSIAGLEYLKLENQKLQSFWKKLMSNFLLIISIFLDSHKQISQRNSQNTDRNEDFADITTHDIEQAHKLANLLNERVNGISRASTESFVSKCDEMIKILKSIQKLMTKRDHKKIDYDMQLKKLDSLLKNPNSTEKDKTKLENHQNKLTEIEIIFKDINGKVNLIVPEVLSSLSEFLNKMIYKIYFSNREILEYIQKNLEKFNRVHGIVADHSILTYDLIINEFNQLHSQGQNRLDNLLLLKDFGSMREKTLVESTTKHVNNAANTIVDTTVNFTSTVYTKASKPNQKLSVSLGSFKIDNPVKPYSKEGIFVSALDPIDFVQQADNLIDVNDQLPTISSIVDFDTSSDLPPTPTDVDAGLVKSPGTGNNQDWLKPLKNSTLNVKKQRDTSGSQSSPLGSEEANLATPDTTFDRKVSSASYAASSLNLDIKSETYKYLSVTVDNITKQIYTIVTQPEITRTPLILKNNELKSHDRLISNLITAKSSIAANAFAGFYST